MLARVRTHEKLIALCGATFIVMAGQGVQSPVLPLYAKAFGVGTTLVGLTVSIFAVARLMFNLPAGMVADRFGRRAILVTGPVLTSIGMFGSAFAGSIWTLMAWRFVAGAGSALYMGGAMVYLIDIAQPHQLTRYVATNQWALSLGVAMGPGLGGLVADRWGLSAPFAMVGVMTLVAAAYTMLRLPETLGLRSTAEGAADSRADSNTATARSIALSRPFLLLAFVSLTIFIIRGGMRGTLLPLYADEAIGWGPREVGLVFTGTGLITLFTLPPSARAADAIGRRWVIIFSGVVAGIGCLVIAGSATAIGFVLGNIVLSLGTGTAGPAPAAFVADITPSHLRGVMVGWYRSAGDVGVIIGPLLLGLIADQVSIAAAMVVAGVLVATAGAAFFIGNAGHPAAGRQR